MAQRQRTKISVETLPPLNQSEKKNNLEQRERAVAEVVAKAIAVGEGHTMEVMAFYKIVTVNPQQPIEREAGDKYPNFSLPLPSELHGLPLAEPNRKPEDLMKSLEVSLPEQRVW